MKTLTIEQYTEKYRDRPAQNAAPAEAEAADFHLPRREPVSHKYSYGRALVIAGAHGYAGAPALAANACERSGAGLTQLMTPESVYPVAAARCDGAVVTPLPETEQGGVSPDAIPVILGALQKADACVIGPGLGTDAEPVVQAVLQACTCPLVLDADALRACTAEAFAARRAPLLLTPHEGEFKRMGGVLTDGRLAGALRFTQAHPGAILILKGYGTLVCRDEEVSVNPTGGPAMAKGGSGDVLCGVLCALLAQGFDPWLAARCAVWLHGLCGDLCAQALGEYSVTPGDLIRRLPEAFLSLQENPCFPS